MKNLIEELNNIIQLLSEERNILQLLKKTPEIIKERAKEIKETFINRTKQGKFVYKTKTESNGNIHRQWILPVASKIKGAKFLSKKRTGSFAKTEEISMKDNVILWCDCGHFTYNLEVSMFKGNVSNIVRSNAQLPVKTNPKMKKFLCKHLVACVKDYEKRIKKY